MDCGVPFCNNGCPLGNLIPEFNNHVYNQDWESAIHTLHATNNFPEFTGRICPAPCEASCTLSINSDPVTIEMIEKNIAEIAWGSGWIKPVINKNKTNKKIAIVGSGPAGLAAAQQLCRAGHSVTVFERNEYIGGLLSIGIPEFKLEKHIVDRRINQMKQEGVKFKANTNVGTDITSDELIKNYDAICLSGGSTIPRDLPIEGRNLNGIHFAMDFLSQQNKKLKGETYIDLENFDVIIMPTINNLVPKNKKTTGDSKFQSPWTAAGLPSISIPSGIDRNGMPLGIQIVGNYLNDYKLLKASNWIKNVINFDIGTPPLLNE